MKILFIGLLVLLGAIHSYAGEKVSSRSEVLSIAIDEDGVHFTASPVAARVLNQKLNVEFSDLKEPLDLVEVKVSQMKSGVGNTLTVRSVIKAREAGSGLATGRRSGSIILQDREGNEVLRYHLYDCYPVKRKIVMDRDTGRIVEEIEFVVEKVERA